MGKNPGDFQRTALKAGGHRAKAEDYLPVGRSTSENPRRIPYPSLEE